MSNNIRVRYGRVGEKRVPKNTLVTMRKNDTIYFGISRCRNTVDFFTKDQGIKLARVRMEVAVKNVASEWRTSGSFVRHHTGLFGKVGVAEIGRLLSYFYNVDEIERPQKR